MILLDTHIWVRWLLPDDPLPPSLPQRIEAADSVAVCTISCWEIGMLVQRGRLSLPLSVSAWVEEATDGSGVEVLPLDCVPAHAAAALPEHHRDPADRLIIATALHLEATLISLDERFPAYFDASPGKAQLVQAQGQIGTSAGIGRKPAHGPTSQALGALLGESWQQRFMERVKAGGVEKVLL